MTLIFTSTNFNYYLSIYFISIIRFFGYVYDKLWTLWVSRNSSIRMREIKLALQILFTTDLSFTGLEYRF